MANQNSLFNVSQDSARSPTATSGDRIAVNRQIPTVPFHEASDSSLEEDKVNHVVEDFEENQRNEDGEVKNKKDAADEDSEENLVKIKENDDEENHINGDEDGDEQDFEEDEDYYYLVKMNRMKKNRKSVYRKHGLART